jgi:RNA polymerase sigma-70 factor, ECF subfamily
MQLSLGPRIAPQIKAMTRPEIAVAGHSKELPEAVPAGYNRRTSSGPNPVPVPAPAIAAQADNSPELALIERVCNGEKELFYDLVKPYQRAVFLAAMSLVQNTSDAEEIAQEALMKAFKHLSSFRRESKFSTWLIQIAINEARMKLRKDRRHLYESLDETNDNDEGDYMPRDLADWREVPSEALERQELRAALQRAIASLGEKYRQVLMLRDVQQLSITETAKALGITEASVKTRLLRARLQMRDALAPGFDGSWSRGETKWKKVRPW